MEIERNVRDRRTPPRSVIDPEPTKPDSKKTQPSGKLPMKRVDLSNLNTGDTSGLGSWNPHFPPMIPMEGDTPLKAAPRSAVFHYSAYKSPKEYLDAPFLHVGSAEQAATVATARSNGAWYLNTFGRLQLDPHTDESITKFSFSPKAEFHPTVVSDEVANRAHEQVAREQGLEVSGDITGAFNGPSDETVVNYHTKQAADALRSGKIVPYRNTHEMADTKNWPENSDKNAMSYLIPNPKLNLQQFK